MLVVVLVVGGLGVVGSALGYREASEAQRLGVMLEQGHRVHDLVHGLLREGMDAAASLDPGGRAGLARGEEPLETALAALAAETGSAAEAAQVDTIDALARAIHGDLAGLFSGTATERERQRLALLAPAYREQRIAAFDREVRRLTDGLAAATAAARTRLLSTAEIAAWLSPLLVAAAFVLAWFTRSNLRREVDAPVARLREGVARIGDGDLAHRVAPAGPRELVELAEGLNRMASELARQGEALAARERDAALGRLVPVVAHNIRNPLASIRATGQLVDGAGADELGRLAGDIVATVDRLERWTRTLLNYLDPARPTLAAHPLRRLVDEALDATRFRIEQKGLECRVKDGVPGMTVQADGDLVEQALHGLLVNAVEAAPPGSLLALAIEADGDGARLVLDDAGPGIAFTPEPGAELRPGPSSKRFGTGLGIPFAYKVCEAHGWKLSFASRPGGGTRVTLQLPTTASDQR